MYGAVLIHVGNTMKRKEKRERCQLQVCSRFAELQGISYQEQINSAIIHQPECRLLQVQLLATTPYDRRFGMPRHSLRGYIQRSAHMLKSLPPLQNGHFHLDWLVANHL